MLSRFRTYGYFWVAVIAIFAVAMTSVQAEPLNVLVLNVDDLKPMLGCYGDKLVKSPNIDALAQKGTTFVSAYCQQAVCAASRVSFYTGMRPDTTGIRDLNTLMRDIHPNVLTLPEYFKSKGYDSLGCGKILHGAKDDDPRSWTRRMDEELSYYNNNAPIAEKYQNESIQKIAQDMVQKKKKINGRVLMSTLKKNNLYPATEGLDLPDDAYADGAIAKMGQSALEQYSQNKKPFFLVLGFKKPHLPFVAPKKYWDLYTRSDIPLHPYQEQKSDRPDYAYHTYGELGAYTGYATGEKVAAEKQRELIHGYLACVSYVDAQIGKVMATLTQTGLDKNTVVVLWGDHGWHLGDHGLWCKHSNFEQATRSPLIISAPGFQQNQVVKSSAEFIDVFPTLCELSQLHVPEQTEGKSLVPLLRDPTAQVKDFALSQYTRHKATGYALRSGPYRLVYWMKNDYISFLKYEDKYLEAVELYDYNKDPYETTNQAQNAEYKNIMSSLRQKMLAYFQQVHDEEKGLSMLAKIKQYSLKESSHD